jgi:iron complex outermembrane recepter protein
LELWKLPLRSFVVFPLCLLAAPAIAQGAAPPATATQAVPAASDIVVTAPRLPGQVDTPLAPIITLDEADIAAYGAANLADLLAALAPQTGSGRGRGSGPPAILINGQRISSFREFRNIPPEAIRRIEVLPEEVALRFGFPPNQRVVNMILRENFAARAVDLEYGGPDRGGYGTSEIEATLLKINRANRFNLNATIDDTSLLTEAERGVIQTSVPSVAGDPDPAAYRALVPDSRSLALTGSWSTGLGQNGRAGSFSVNGNITRSDNRALSGLNLVQLTAPGGATALRSLPGPLEPVSRSVEASGGTALNTRFGAWQFSATVDATHAESQTFTDQRADTSALVAAAALGTLSITGPLSALPLAAQARTFSNSERLESLITLTGQPLRLPAGEVSLTLKTGLTWIDFRTADSRSASGPVALNRFRVHGGFNLGVPLTSRNEHFGGAIGDVSLNFSASLSDVSDFGAVNDWSAGLNWSPTDKLGLQASYIVNQETPAVSQLGNPAAISLNVPVFDFARNETALVTVTSGGNPLLKREQQRDLKFSANWQMPFLSNSSLLVEYFRNHSNDVTAAFPVLTPAIEAAFTGRVTRDSSGRLIAVDRRPVTLAETRGERIRWGFNLSGAYGHAAPGGLPGMGGPGARPPGAGGPRPGGMPGGPPGGGRGPGGGGGFGGPMMAMMGGGGGQGRWNLSVYHTIRFSESVLIAPGVPLLNLLDGDALTGGGVARQAVEFEGGTFYRGFGLRFGGSFTAPTHLNASGAPGTSDLRFGSLFKLDLRAFINMDQQRGLVRALPFLKGSRLMLVAENVLDQRQRVTDASGAVPLGYQADYLDPRGRWLGVDFRKVF